MGKKITWDEYNIRTLSYYQKQGGMFSDLITVLQKARTNKSVLTYIPKHTPARLLNIASYIADLVMADKENSAQLLDKEIQKYPTRYKDDQYLVFSILYVMIGDSDCDGANNLLMQFVGSSIIYKKLNEAYHKEAFKSKMPLQEVLSSEERTQFETIIRIKDETIKTKEDIIQSQNSTIADQSNHIDVLQDMVSKMAHENELAKAAAFKGSQLDKTLTLDYIIGHIAHKRTYENSSQLIDMLKGRLIRIATDEEVAKIEKIEQKMLDASVPGIHNDIKNSQVFQAPIHNPTFQLPMGFTEEMLKEAIEQYLKQKNNEGHE